ncbi:hypothetical protein X801_03963, partial [Opisthorchis viverrini]
GKRDKPALSQRISPLAQQIASNEVVQYVTLLPTDKFSHGVLDQRQTEQLNNTLSNQPWAKLRMSEIELRMRGAAWWPSSTIKGLLITEITGVISFHAIPSLLAIGVQSRFDPSKKQYILVFLRSGCHREKFVRVLKSLCRHDYRVTAVQFDGEEDPNLSLGLSNDTQLEFLSHSNKSSSETSFSSSKRSDDERNTQKSSVEQEHHRQGVSDLRSAKSLQRCVPNKSTSRHDTANLHSAPAKNNEQCNRLANLLWKLKAVPTAFDEKPVSRPCVDAELSLNGVDALKAQTTSMERNIENQSVYLDDARGAKTKIPTRSFLVAQVGGFVVGKSEYVDENRIENYLAQSQDRLEANNITFDILTVHPDGLTLKRGDWWPRDEEQKLNINELNRVDYCKSTDNLLVLDYKFPESNKRRICLFAADTPEERKLLVKQIKDLKTQRNMSPCTDSASENQRKNTMSQELSGEDYNVPISREQHSDKIPTSMSKTCRASPDKKRENQKDSPKILKCEKIGREPNGPQDFPKRSIYQFPLDHVDAFSVDAEEILDPQKIEDYLSRKRQVTSGEMVIMEIDSDGIKLDKGLWWSENPRVLKRTQSGIHAIFPLPSDDKLWALAYFTFDLRLKRVHIFRSFSLEDRNKTIATLRNYVNPDISAIINLARELGLRQNGLDGHYVTSCAVKVGQQGGHEKILTANSTGRNKEIVLSPRNTPIKSTPSIHHQMERYDKVDVKDTIDLQFDEEDDERLKFGQN